MFLNRGFMKFLRIAALAAAVNVLLVLPVMACTARLIDVTKVAGGCVYGPTGCSNCIQVWDVEPGHTYTLTIGNVTECGNGGTASTLNVRVKNLTVGNTDHVAVYVSPGVYRFDYTMPANGACLSSILYCTTPGVVSGGLPVLRNDGVYKQAYLRASRFESVGVTCANPIPILGLECGGVLGTEESNWGKIKSIYR